VWPRAEKKLVFKNVAKDGRDGMMCGGVEHRSPRGLRSNSSVKSKEPSLLLRLQITFRIKSTLGGAEGNQSAWAGGAGLLIFPEMGGKRVKNSSVPSFVVYWVLSQRGKETKLGLPSDAGLQMRNWQSFLFA